MRLFIAIEFPPPVKKLLAEYAATIGALALRANITLQENFHLTLAFLGDTLTVTETCTALSEIQSAAFKLYSDKVGLFKRSHGNIYWLGLKSSSELQALHEQLSNSLAKMGMIAEKRPFSPHITLARDVQSLSGELAVPPRFIVNATALSLMNSERIKGLLTYTTIYEKRFEEQAG
ncbi:MAG: RNA 2',3'-cyclic phosphodiesterase [Firmicutes bacterium]|nr:RNA 2',3'-cyclic phosphodiesterase [Bacillota bacterium]